MKVYHEMSSQPTTSSVMPKLHPYMYETHIINGRLFIGLFSILMLS